MEHAERVARQGSLMGRGKAGKVEGSDRAKEATKGNITHFLVQKERIYLNQQKDRLMKGPLSAPVNMIFGLTGTAIVSTFSFKSGYSNQKLMRLAFPQLRSSRPPNSMISSGREGFAGRGYF